MSEFQRGTILFAVLFVVGIAAGLEAPLPTARLGLFFGLATAGAFAGFLFLRGYHLRLGMLALALGGAGAGYTLSSLELDRSSPNHLVNFGREPGSRAMGEPPLFTEIYGCIDEDPDVRSRYTNLIVRPAFLVELDKNRRPVRRVPVDKGRVLVRLNRKLMNDPRARSLGYGDLIATREAELVRPALPLNPTYNYRAYLESQGIFAMSELRAPYQIRRLRPEDAKVLGLVGCEGKVKSFALGLRESFLRVIKQTFPHPESAFIGGVLLGLRGGMSTIRYQHLREPFLDGSLTPWEKIRRAFGPWSLKPGPVPTNAVEVYKATGTAHILAVSGLHVGIIAGLLAAILAGFGVPRWSYAVVVIPCVWVFAILVGARPSTLRAATMVSAVVASYSLFSSSLKVSALFGCAVAALVVLTLYPAAAWEASVTYSFAAVLSLILLTGPFHYYLKRYVRGPLGIGLLLFFYTIFCHAAMSTLFGLPHWTLLAAVAAVAAGALLEGRLPFSLAFSRLPEGLRLFMAAQFAILAGLVFPLNTYYFQQLPVSSPLGNLVAIPGLTVVLFLAMLGVLIFFLPLVGPALSLVLAAANWFFVKYIFFPPLVILFWLVDWPSSPPPKLWHLGVYYLMLVGFAWHREIADGSRRLYYRIEALARAPSLRRSAGLAVALVGLAVLSALVGAMAIQPGASLRVSFLHPYMFSSGAGHPILIEAPTGEVVLVDGGPRYLSGRRTSRPFDVGERILRGVLLAKRIRKLDRVVVTNLSPDNFGGLLTVLERFDVGRVVDPYGPELAHDASDEGYERFLLQVGDAQWREHRLSNVTRLIYDTYVEYRKMLEEKGIELVRGEAGMELMEEGLPRKIGLRVVWVAVFGGLLFMVFLAGFARRLAWRPRAVDIAFLGLLLALIGGEAWTLAGRTLPRTSLEILWPESMPAEGMEAGVGAVEGRSIVLRLEQGDFSALLPSDLPAREQERLLERLPREKVRAGLLSIPSGGWPEGLSEKFIQAVAPKAAVGVGQLNRFNRRKIGYVLGKYRDASVRVYFTGDSGAILVETDGTGDAKIVGYRENLEAAAAGLVGVKPGR